MCYLKPLKVVKIEGRKVLLEQGIAAFYDKKIGTLKPNDKVLVYGNLIVSKIKKSRISI